MKEKIKKYLPDGLFLFGTWITSYAFLRPVLDPASIILAKYGIGGIANYKYKILGIMLIALALDIAIRRYFAKRNSE